MRHSAPTEAWQIRDLDRNTDVKGLTDARDTGSHRLGAVRASYLLYMRR